MLRVVSYTEGATLVALRDGVVHSYRRTDIEEECQLTQYRNEEVVGILYTGTEEEVAAILEGIREDLVAPKAAEDEELTEEEASVGLLPRAPTATVPVRTAIAMGVSALAVALALGFGGAHLLRSSQQASGAQAGLPSSQARVADAASGDPSAARAPDAVADPTGDDEASLQTGGNAQPTGNLSPHGASGASLTDARGRDALLNRPAGRVPDASRMPPLPDPGTRPAPQPPKEAQAAPQRPVPKPGGFTVVASSDGGAHTPAGEQAKLEALARSGLPPSVPKTSQPVTPTVPTPPTKVRDMPQEALAPAAAPVQAKAADASHAPSQDAGAPATGAITTSLADIAKDVDTRTSGAREEARKVVKDQGTDAAADEVAKLKSAASTLQDGGKLTPEIVRGLPIELAKRLTDEGAVETQEETAARIAGATGKKSFTIVHLPPGTLEHHVDKDGVPTIPDGDSWAMTGGNVVLPMPGGGEIHSPADFALFDLDG